MRDITVLRQIAADLDRSGGLHTQVVFFTETIDWPSLLVQTEHSTQIWYCKDAFWTGQVLDEEGTPIATIQTTIGDDAYAGEVADRIMDIYRMLRTLPETR